MVQTKRLTVHNPSSRAVLDFTIATVRPKGGFKQGDGPLCVIRGDAGLVPPRHIQQGGANLKLTPHRCSHRDIQTNVLALFPVAPSEMSGPLCSCDKNSFRFLLGPPVADPCCAAPCFIWISKSVRRWPDNLNPRLLALLTVKCDCWCRSSWRNNACFVREEAEFWFFMLMKWFHHGTQFTFILTDHWNCTHLYLYINQQIWMAEYNDLHCSVANKWNLLPPLHFVLSKRTIENIQVGFLPLADADWRSCMLKWHHLHQMILAISNLMIFQNETWLLAD